MTVTANGYFGPQTEEAVKAFQKVNGIDQLGFVGPSTRAALNKGATTPPVFQTPTTLPPTVPTSYIFTQTLRPGSSGVEVLQLQKKLQVLGMFPMTVTANGYFGPQTEEAVKAFQKVNGIDQLGFVGPSTRAALNKD